MRRLRLIVMMGGVLALSSPVFANCVAPPSGILAWWPGEGSAEDIAGGNSGMFWNGATTAPGLIGSAFSFNGTNAYVSLPDNLFPLPPTAPADSPFSFESWFKTASGGVILGQQTGVPFTGASGWVPAIYVGTDGKLRAEVFWDGHPDPLASTQSVADNVFHHLAVTYDGTNETLYLDGRRVDSRPFSQVSYASSYKYQLGVGYTGGYPGANGGWYAFGGLIDEPALYNRALSATEVAAIYAAGAAGKCQDSMPPVITLQPASLEASVGSDATIRAGANGAAPLAYQWQLDGTNLPEETNATLVLSNVTATQAGGYSVFVANPYGAAQSATGVVTVVFPLTLDATVTNGVPYAGAGNLESPGAQDVYAFEAPPSRIIYLGVLSSYNRLFWSLTAPDGTAVFTGHYMPYDDIRRLELPMPGTYRLTVYNDSGVTGTYSFRISAVTDQAFTIAPGTVVTNGVPASGAGDIEMPGSFDEYLFTAPSNHIAYLGVLSSFNRLFWSLTAPDGSAVFSAHYMPYNDVGRVQLPLPGTYRLRVYDDDNFTGSYSFELLGEADQVFNIAVGDTVTNGVPGPGAGNLETPGTWDDYLFTAPPNHLVYFDVLSSFNRLFWSLYGPDNSPIFSAHYMPYDDVGRITLPQPGTYRLRVYNDSGNTGTYSFRLSGITDQVFDVATGDTVSNGAPATGAGDLEVPGAYDDYLFQAPTNRAVYFDVLSAPPHLFWTLYAPDNSTVFSAHYLPYNDVGRVDLPQFGAYRLRVYSDNDTTGAYSFKLWNVIDRSFDISIGSVVTNGVPAPGAGVLESPGADHLFTFSGNAGQRVRFNDRNSSPSVADWRVLAPAGAQLFSDRLDGNDPGTFTLPVTGTYFLHVRNDSDRLPVDYSFALLDSGATNAPPLLADRFNIAIGDIITNGVPAPGAGNLETNGALDVYTFTSGVGQVVYFEDRGATPSGQIRYDVYDQDWNPLFGEWLNGGQDVGRQTLSRGGAYYLIARGNNNAVAGTYSLKLWPVTDQTFTINIGDTVTNGLPGPGAGVIESPGGHDIYTFMASPGQQVYFEDRGSTGSNIRYDVYDSRNTWLFGEWLNGNQDVGRQTLALGGAYTIVVSGSANDTGDYSFKLWSVPPDQSFALSVGDTITNGLPAPGAGNIEIPGARDIYTFNASAGQTLFFQDLGATPLGQIRYDVYDDRGASQFGEWLNGNQDVGRQTLARTGAYTLIVSGIANATGTYSLKIWPVTDQSFTLNVGDLITNGLPGPGAGIIESPGDHDVYTFTASPQQLVYLQDLGSNPNGQIRYDVYDQDWNLLFGEWLNANSDVGLQRLSRGGTYYLVTSGNADATGTYSLRLWTPCRTFSNSPRA